MNKDFFKAQGEVVKILRNKSFSVKCDNGRMIIANIAARFRTSTGRRKIKIVEGEKVVVEIPLGDLEKGQIVSLQITR